MVLELSTGLKHAADAENQNVGQGDLVLITGSTVWQQKAIKIKASDRNPVRKTNSHPKANRHSDE